MNELRGGDDFLLKVENSKTTPIHTSLCGIYTIKGLRCHTEEALNGIGGLNVAVHRGGELVKRQEVFFILSQASYRFGIAFAIFGFEGC